MPRWLGSLLVLVLVGPLLLLVALWQGWLLVFAILTQGVGLVVADSLERRGSGRPQAIGSWLLFVTAVVGSCWIYWGLGGAEPAIFTVVSVGWPILAIPFVLSRAPRDGPRTDQGDAR